MNLNELWRLVRHRPDFLRDPLEGQMTPKERKAIYDLVRRFKPETIFEIGTWKGGGSTYILSSALYHNTIGRLDTIEANKEFYDHCLKLYSTKLSFLAPQIHFHFGNSLEIYPSILDKLPQVDFLLLDGAEDQDQTLREFRLFENKLLPHSIVVCHDWNTLKAKAVKPLLLDTDKWEKLIELNEGPTGLAAFNRLAF